MSPEEDRRLREQYETVSEFFAQELAGSPTVADRAFLRICLRCRDDLTAHHRVRNSSMISPARRADQR
jgi:hypothetical protein